MVLLPFLYGQKALVPTGTMIAAGILGVAIYKLLKATTARPRPFAVSRQIRWGIAAPLDEYSFPSGHSLHAACFTIITTSYYPELGWIFVPFAILVALSRVVLGLHYPSDVLAGALLGALIGIISLAT